MGTCIFPINCFNTRAGSSFSVAKLLLSLSQNTRESLWDIEMGEVLDFISQSVGDYRIERKRESVPDPDVLTAALSPLLFCPLLSPDFNLDSLCFRADCFLLSPSPWELKAKVRALKKVVSLSTFSGGSLLDHLVTTEKQAKHQKMPFFASVTDMPLTLTNFCLMCQQSPQVDFHLQHAFQGQVKWLLCRDAL